MLFAFVKVVGEFELKTLANLVIILNQEALYGTSREHEAFSCGFLALKNFKSFEKPLVNTTFWAAYALTSTNMAARENSCMGYLKILDVI